MEEMIAVGIAIGFGDFFARRLLAYNKKKKKIRIIEEELEKRKKAHVQGHEDFIKDQKQIS
ncbi:hypothetical protein EUAN_12620 [Andreesenia angusta]|uniref:Uncharacterized protein n=1 Tax=Andreesenia angusta TaxID=39480 RepID=A0A1S1V6D4_9FIRM|nr:hypothetical protein [Andreesenia angusta]OHW62193.1 hypothetical protein EUAN_12620 [Andreesenia angusta]